MNIPAGIIAYQAYGENRGWKTWDNRDMPSWDDLTLEIRDAWVASAEAVIKEYGQVND